MARKSDERVDCDGDGDGESIQAGILIIPSSTGKYDRFWLRGWNVGRFIRLCRKASLLKAASQHVTRFPSAIVRLALDHSDNGVPSPTTVPLLQSEEPNGASSAGSHLAMEPHEEPSSSPVFRMRQSLLRRSASSAHQSQLAIDPKKSYTADEAPSPSATEPLLPSDSAQTHLTIDVQSDNAEDEELQKNIARIFDENDLDSLQKFGGAEKLALAFGSNLESGKNTVSGESIVTYKKQVLVKDFPGFFVRACNSYTIFLLIISACFSLVFEMVEKGPKNGWRDGAAIFLAVLLIVTVDSVSSFREARKQGKNTERGIKVTVIRRGQSDTIYGIVKGDLVCLERDQTVPADGLLVSGSLEVDGRSDKHIDSNQNPFLFSGSMVVGGHGRMLVTSVGSNVVSFKEPLLEARISKPNTCAEFFSLCMASLIVLVLFLRFLHRKHDYDDGGSSQIKGEITVQGVLKNFERMLLKPRGTISILTSFLAAAVIGIQHGMPFVISISLAYWNEKKATDEVVPQNLSACGTMGLVTVICIDISGGLIGVEEASEMSEDAIESLRQHQRKMEEAVRTFKMAGVDIKLVSGDDELSALIDKARELGIYSVGSTDEAVEGQYIRNLCADELKRRADQIKVMAKFLPKDKLSLVQCLKEKGHVVAFYGGSTARDALVLKEADVGISDEKSTEMAKKSSDIIIRSYESFVSLIPICMYGRWAYYNIQRFIQLQLTVMVSSLVITSVATMALRESPITLIQLIWVNLVTSILGGLMLIMEPHSQELRTFQAAGNRNAPVITKAMWVFILTQIIYQASVLLVFLFKGQSIPGINRRVRKAIIFNSFSLCQVFNYVNAMVLEGKWSDGVKQKGCLLIAVGTAVAVQVLVGEIWARLNWLQWAFCFLISVVSLSLGLAMKALSPFMTKWSFSSISSHLRHSGFMPSRHDFCLIVFSSLFFLFSFSHCFNSDAARAFD